MIDLLGNVAEEEKAPAVPPLPGEVMAEQSNLAADKQAYEQTEESKEHFLEEAPEVTEPSPFEREAATEAPGASIAPPAAVPVPVVKDEVTIRVEKILEEGLGDVYQTLSPEAQVLFQQKGEETAGKVTDMLKSVKVEVGKILHWIRDWLMLVPHANKFFLEQEAKIKTDRILEYSRDLREGTPTLPS